jgi:hypothetical protein
MVTRVNNNILEIAKRVDLMCSYHTLKKKELSEVMDVLISLSVVILQYIHVPNNLFMCQLHLKQAER